MSRATITAAETDGAAPGSRAYRAYRVGQDGRIGSVMVIDADSDDEAREIAAPLSVGCGVDLWERERFIASYPPLPVPKGDSGS